MDDDRNRSQEIAVGVFVLLAIAGLIYLSFRIGGGRPSGAAVYDLMFDSALGLQRDNMVSIAGVRVGLVEDIQVEGQRARVRIAVTPGLEIFTDASAAVRARTLLGEKYVDLIPGTPGGARLASGAVIDRTVPTIEIDQLIRGSQEVIARANQILPTLQAAVDKVDGLVRNSDFESTATSLSEVLGEVGELVRTMARISRESGKDLGELLVILKQRGPGVLDRLDKVLGRIDRLAAAVPEDALADAIGKAPRAVDNADRALADLRVAVADLRSVSKKGTKIASMLERVLSKVDGIDEKTLREFMQVQGFRVNLVADPGVVRRIRELKNRQMPLPGQE